MESNKKILNAQVIANSIKGQVSTSKKGFGIIMCFFAVCGFEMMIAGLVFVQIPVILLGLVLGVALLYFGIRNIKASKLNSANLQAGNYRIVKTVCIGYVDASDDESTSIVTKFENGAQVDMLRPLGTAGDVFYLVYLDGAKKPNAFFNAAEYIPDANLKIEEYLPAGR